MPDSATHASLTAPAATVPATPAPTQATPTPATPTPIVDSTPARAPAPTPLVGPIVPHGRTDLPDSLFAVRRGDTVVVNFDTGPARTRRADKFETLVRRTLPAVFGPLADTLLAAVPSGKLASAKELVTTLPKRGIRLQGAHGPRLALWPETHPGRDGPLVFAYRTVIEK